MWLLRAEREYLLAQALPNRTVEQLEDTPYEVLDAVLMVQDVYRAIDVERRQQQQQQEM